VYERFGAVLCAYCPCIDDVLHKLTNADSYSTATDSYIHPVTRTDACANLVTHSVTYGNFDSSATCFHTHPGDGDR
jgi:hypothetical protein